MVEMAGVEPASEKPSLQLSPGAAAFQSPGGTGTRQTVSPARRLIHDGLRASHPFTFTAESRPNRSRGTHRPDGRLFKQREQLYCCRLFLRFGAFQEVLRFRPLIGVRIPRRNPFIPILNFVYRFHNFSVRADGAAEGVVNGVC